RKMLTRPASASPPGRRSTTSPHARRHAMVAPTDVEQLRSAVRGRVVRAQDPGYDTARRVWNGMVDLHPALVVRGANADDVAAVLAFARSRRILLAVRGGGHSVAGNGTVADGVVIDLGALHRVEVSEADDATVRVGGGATLADVDRATSPLGLAVPIGVVSLDGGRRFHPRWRAGLA